MLTFDEIFRAYQDGAISRCELCGHLLQVLASVSLDVVEKRLRTEPGLSEEFEAWADAVSSGAEVFAGSVQMRFSDDDRAAAERFLARMRAGRYATLAHQMKQWMTEAHEEEPALEPDEIEPLQWPDVEPLLEEAA
ncbi:hypothetical protein [Sorangium sp. So ce426]|uniref:hypothetical protein n=1 Tax=Sorangium sp. So ce426 TaxID=3133312 RepID=UPI003F5B8118